MATAAAAADDDEHTEPMEQVGGEERAAEAVEAMEQVEEEERAVAEEEAAADAVEAMEQGEGEERAEATAEEEAEGSDEGPVEAMEQVEEEDVQAEAAAAAAAAAEDVQAEEAEEEVQARAAEEAEAEALSTVLPLGRVKKIMRVDRDIKKVPAEASLLIAAATELFLGTLAAGAHTAATQSGRRAVRAVDVRAAARAHRPTADFLLDCLPAAEEAPRAARTGSDGAVAAAAAATPKPLPRGTRRIDGFFQKVT